MESSGQLLAARRTVFCNLVGADTNDARDKHRSASIRRSFAAHRDAIVLNRKLFARIEVAVRPARRRSAWMPKSMRLLERYHNDFVRAGAKLSDADKVKLKAMNAELATLGTKFSQNVLAEVNASAVVVDTPRASSPA